MWRWGRFYWGRKEEGAEGIVVLFAWLSSEDRHVKQYVNLYASLGWNSLVCHTDFLTLFFPDKATSLGHGVLEELQKEIGNRPLPVVFAAFSGGSKGCLYKILQKIEGKCEGAPDRDEYRPVRDCVCGQIYDSSPVDFTSDLGTRFILHPSVLKMSHPPRVVSWMAKAVASGLDTLFLNRFETQRADYWKTLHSSVNWGPFLIFCSEDDDLAPYPVVSNFAQRLQALGGDVKLMKWDSSPHVGHFKHHPNEYKDAVTELLAKAAVNFSQRMNNPSKKGMTGGCNHITKSIYDLHKAAMTSNESLRRVAIGPSDHFFLPSSVEYHETNNAATVRNEQKGALFQLGSPRSTIAYGVLGKILFDECVPKNIEGWDLNPSGSLNGRRTRLTSDSKRQFNPIKCIRRSRL